MRLYDRDFASALLLGTALYPSPAIMAAAIEAAEPALITVSLRRESAGGGGERFWAMLKELGVPVLPNTAGCHTAREAITTAEMARELFDTDWIKLEVIGDPDTLHPDALGLVEAARELTDQGFQVLPYCTEDLSIADRLADAGCRVLMPWGAPIGTARGLNNPYGLRALRARFPDLGLIVDAGLGLPSHAAAAMELGYDGVLLNTAVAKAGDPVAMAKAFAQAVEAGAAAYRAGPMPVRDMAAPSTPVLGQMFR